VNSCRRVGRTQCPHQCSGVRPAKDGAEVSDRSSSRCMVRGLRARRECDVLDGRRWEVWWAPGRWAQFRREYHGPDGRRIQYGGCRFDGFSDSPMAGSRFSKSKYLAKIEFRKRAGAATTVFTGENASKTASEIWLFS
jgi:hypothetical protein